MKDENCKKTLKEMRLQLEVVINELDTEGPCVKKTLQGIFEARKKLAKVYLSIPDEEAQKYSSYIQLVDQLINDHLSCVRWKDYQAALSDTPDYSLVDSS